MKERTIKKQFNKVAKKSIKENKDFFKKHQIFDAFILAINTERKLLNTTTKGVILDNLKGYVTNLVEDIEDSFYNKVIYPNIY